MPKFLVDENLSPIVARELRRMGYSAKAAREVGLKGKPDEEILAFAARRGYAIVTADKEFGAMFYRHLGTVSIALLRSRFQGTSNFIRILKGLHKNGTLRTMPSKNCLVVASSKAQRARSFTDEGKAKKSRNDTAL